MFVYYCSVDNNLLIWKYNENENVWNRIIASTLKQRDGLPVIVKLACASPDLVAFLEYDGNEIFGSISCFMFNLTNGLTLKDICFLKLWKAY